MSTRRGGQTKLNDSQLIKCYTINLRSLTNKQLHSKFSVLYYHAFNQFTAISRLAPDEQLCLGGLSLGCLVPVLQQTLCLS